MKLGKIGFLSSYTTYIKIFPILFEWRKKNHKKIENSKTFEMQREDIFNRRCALDRLEKLSIYWYNTYRMEKKPDSK